VRPGVFEVRASPLWSQIAFNAVDLPALERPANATSAPVSGGSWCVSGALSTNCAARNGLLAVSDRMQVAVFSSDSAAARGDAARLTVLEATGIILGFCPPFGKAIRRRMESTLSECSV